MAKTLKQSKRIKLRRKIEKQISRNRLYDYYYDVNQNKIIYTLKSEIPNYGI